MNGNKVLKGVIFDFNGTLFYDTPLHIEAWREYSKKLRGTPFTDKEMEEHMIGHTNADIIEYALGKIPDKEMALEFAAEKEAVYREMCMKDSKCTKLVDGAVELFDFLVKNNIPLTIATGSDKTNLDFFVEIFNLGKWFDLSKIVYDDGTFAGKPAPDMYLQAADNIGLRPFECIVFEDAIAGIESAQKASIGKIIAITPDKKAFFENVAGVDSVIKDFKEFDCSVFAHNYSA